MERRDDFERFFQDKLHQAETPVDTDRLWSQIEPDTTYEGEHKSDNSWPFLLLILIFIPVGLMFNQNFKGGQELASNNTVPETTDSRTTNSGTTNSGTTNSGTTNSGTTNSMATNLLTRNPQTTNPTKKKSIKINRNLTSNNTVLKPTQKATVVQDEKQSSTSTVLNESFDQLSAASISLTGRQSMDINASNEDLYLDDENQSNGIGILAGYSEKGQSDRFRGQHQRQADVLGTRDFKGRLDFLNKEVQGTEIDLDVARVHYNNKPTPFSHWVSLSVGLSGLERNLVANPDEDLSYIDLRNRTEMPLEALSLGLEYALIHRSGIFMKTGLEYVQINEAFNYQYEVVEQEVQTFYSIVGYVEDSTIEDYVEREGGKFVVEEGDEGDRLVQADEQFAQQKEEENYILSVSQDTLQTTRNYDYLNYNHHRILQLPLQLGYRQQFDRFGIYGQAGIVLNLKYKASGLVAIDDKKVGSFSEQGNFKNQLGMSFRGSFGGSYQMTRSLSIFVEPQIQYFNTSFTKSVSKQTYTLYGLKIGMSKKF